MKNSIHKYCNNRGRKGLTLLELLIVIVVIVILIGLVGIPSSPGHAKKIAIRIKCASNLKQVGWAFNIWQADNGGRFPMQVITNSPGAMLYANSIESFLYFQVVSNKLSDPRVVVCPADPKRYAATNFDTGFNGTHISYFIGLDAETNLPQSFLAGDANLTNGLKMRHGLLELDTNQPAGWTAQWHQERGNVALADGSVQQFTTSDLRSALHHTGLATNRLLMPDSAAGK